MLVFSVVGAGMVSLAFAFLVSQLGTMILQVRVFL